MGSVIAACSGARPFGTSSSISSLSTICSAYPPGTLFE
jgi:hypothetical protein